MQVLDSSDEVESARAGPDDLGASSASAAGAGDGCSGGVGVELLPKLKGLAEGEGPGDVMGSLAGSRLALGLPPLLVNGQ